MIGKTLGELYEKTIHPRIATNRVIRHFFQNRQHVYLWLKLREDAPCCRRDFEFAFKRFYFNIRFTAYVASIIRYSSYDQNRKYKKIDKYNPLLYDQPLKGESGGGSLGEIWLEKYAEDLETSAETSEPQIFRESLDNKKLVNAFSALTDRQQLIITWSYSLCLRDHEIANILKVSEQAIQKCRSTALRKMKIAIQSGFGNK